MQPQDFLLPGPAFEMTAEKKKAFDLLWKTKDHNALIDYRLTYPKWQFLSYLCETYELVLHGSQNQDIRTVEPRQADDKRAYSNQNAIYATTDGIWVIYFAILDRWKYPSMTLFNSCLQIRSPSAQLSDPLYFFSISQSTLLQTPWCKGAVYILPRRSFQQEAAHNFQGVEVVFPHWISESPVEPDAYISVGPQDFPFLSQIHGHNDERLVKLFSSDPDGFPWVEALES